MALLREEMDVSHVMIDSIEYGGGGNDQRGNSQRPQPHPRLDHGYNGSGSSVGNHTPMQAEQYQVNVTITKVGNNIIQSKIDSKYTSEIN